MRVLLLLWLAAFAAASPHPAALESDLQPPPAPSQVATKRLGFGGGDGDSMFGKIAHWFFPGNDGPVSPGRAISRSPYVHGPPRHHPPPPKHFNGPPRPKIGPQHHPPSPPLKCNPCNKVPWVPIPHAQYQDGGNNFAVVNAPQLLHQGLHGGPQPNVPVYHHSPLPQGYLPSFDTNSAADQSGAQSLGGVDNGPSAEVIPSISVASFVSSIEYPINVVQSPIIDLGGTGGGEGSYKSLTDVNVPPNTVSEIINHPPPVVDNSVPVINAGGSGHGDSASSYQNVNLHAENTVHRETHSGPAADISITPSVQTAVDLHQEPQIKHENVQVVNTNYEGTVPPPIPTQQQLPLEQPAVPFQIQTFQQPPSIQPPAPFNVQTSGFASTGPSRLTPPHPGPPQVFFNPPPQYQQPPRAFSSPGQINLLRQAPSAPGLSPPPPPSAAGNPNHPYRFELFPPSGNALQNLNQHGATAPPAPDFTAWAPPSGQQAGAPLSSSHAVSTHNHLDDLEASGLRSQWHHREINHQIQESRIQESRVQETEPKNDTTSTTSRPQTTVHVLASDIRALLRAEQQRQQVQYPLQNKPPQQPQFQIQNKPTQQNNPNLVRLQHNIDQWTAQEFSNGEFQNVVNIDDKHKITTAAGTLAPSKHIPREYFSTSPTYIPSTRTYITSTRAPPSSTPDNFFDHEAAGSIAHNVHAKTTHVKNSVYNKENKVEETTTETDVTTVTTTEEPITSTTTVEPRRTTWEQALLGYSTRTNEKVYVVTPMSTHQWVDDVITTPRSRPSSSTTPKPTTTEKSSKGFVIRGRGGKQQPSTTVKIPTSVDASSFRSPRFTVRPTPAPRPFSEPTIPVDSLSRGNRYYTVPTPASYQPPTLPTTTTEQVVTAERRSSSVLPADLSTVPTATPPPGQNVHIAAKHSKVVTVITSSTSSSIPTHNKKATRLTKPAPVVKQEDHEEVQEEEVAAAVREVSAVDLKRKLA